MRAGESVTGNVLSNDLDPEGDGWQAPVVMTPPAHGTVELGAEGTFTYTAALEFIGSDPWTYQVCDLGEPEACAEADVLITVAPPNGRPVAGDDWAVTRVNTPVSGNLLANDMDPDGSVLTVTTRACDRAVLGAGQPVVQRPVHLYARQPGNRV